MDISTNQSLLQAKFKRKMRIITTTINILKEQIGMAKVERQFIFLKKLNKLTNLTIDIDVCHILLGRP